MAWRLLVLVLLLACCLKPVEGFCSPPLSPRKWGLEQGQNGIKRAAPFSNPVCPHEGSSGPWRLMASGDSDGNSEEKTGIYGYSEKVIALEQSQVKFRGLRLVSLTLVLILAWLALGVSGASFLGVESADRLAENAPNPLIDVGVGGLCFYLWTVEVASKRVRLRNIKLDLEGGGDGLDIDAKMERREASARERESVPRGDENRFVRRAQAEGRVEEEDMGGLPGLGGSTNRSRRKGRKGRAAKKGKGLAAITQLDRTDDRAQTTPEPQEKEQEAVEGNEEKRKEKGGLFGNPLEKMKEGYASANAMAYVSAVKLNDDLEQRGILEPVAGGKMDKERRKEEKEQQQQQQQDKSTADKKAK